MIRHRGRQSPAERCKGIHDRARVEDNGIDRIGGVIRPCHMDDPRIDADPDQAGQRILKKVLKAFGGHQCNDDMFVHCDPHQVTGSPACPKRACALWQCTR